ncbi:hypothetical protein [Trichothermofontia sp.]
MLFRQLFDYETYTYTYLIADRNTCEAVLVDPVLEQVDRDLNLLKELGLTLRYCLKPTSTLTTLPARRSYVLPPSVRGLCLNLPRLSVLIALWQMGKC